MAVRRFASSNVKSGSRNCNARKHGAEGRRRRLNLEPLESRRLLTVFDLTTAGAQATDPSGAIYKQFSDHSAAGNGVINAFIGVQANGTEQGYNTTGTTEFDSKQAHALQLGSIPVVQIGGNGYREFVLDINQLSTSPLISLDQLKLFVGSTSDETNYATNPFFATPVYDLDAVTDNSVKLDQSLSGSGSGRLDMAVFIPNSAFASFQSTDFVYLFSRFGDEFAANGGFEDWAVGKNAQPVTSTIEGFKFNDLNGDGSDDGGADPRLSGVTINLYRDSNADGVFDAGDALAATTTTDATGQYTFGGLTPDTYFVREAVPSGYVQTAGGADITVGVGSVYLTSEQSTGASNEVVVPGLAFGDFHTASPTIGTTANPTIVTLDSSGSPTLNDSATLSGGFDPIGTITFTLYSPANTVIDTETATTAGNGTYSTPTGFTLPVDAVPGTYQWVASYSGDGNNNGVSTNMGDEPVVVSAASPTIGTTANPASVTLNGSGSPTLKDSATLSGGFDPIGTITFTLYSPANTVIDTETATTAGNGTYSTPTGFTLPVNAAPGTYQWVASYSGDGNNNGVSTNMGDEPVVVSAASPTIGTTANPASVTLNGSGSPTLKDSATLSGGFDPIGTITFTLYSPANTVIDTETATAAGNGTYSTPTGFTLPVDAAPGTYQWVASYGGDGNNNGVSTTNGDEPVVVSAASPTIGTTANPAKVTLNGSGSPTLNDSATLSGGFDPIGTITFTLYSPANAVIDTETATANGNGTYSTPTGFTLPAFAAPGTYQWVASYGGDGNNNSVSTTMGDEPVVVNAASPTIGTTANPANVTLNGSGSPTLNDSATLSGGFDPIGTITFTLYSPANAVIDTETATANGNGTYSTPTGFTLPAFAAPGTYQWVASYGGDGNNNSVSTTMGDEPVVVNAASPTIGTTANPANVTLNGSGSPTLNDSATLSGGFNPVGTITFTLYSPIDTLIDTETATVNGNGTYSTPSGFTLPTNRTVTGTFQWVASYSGDGNNNSVSSHKGDEPVVIRAACPTITTTPGGTVVIGSGAKLTDSATLAGGFHETGLITFTLYNPNNIVVDTVTATVNGNGVYNTPTGFLPTLAGTYQWVATYSGDGNNNSVASAKGNEPECVKAQVIVVAMDKSPTTPQSVEVVDGSTGTVLSQFIPYGNTFQGGIRIATGDLLGNGVDEIVTAPGRGATPLIKVYSETGTLLTSFLAYSSSNTGGLNVTIADVNGDGKPDIITVPSQGTAEVKVFLNQSTGGTVSFKTTPYKDFLGFPSTMISGAVIAAADMGHTLANGTFTNAPDGKAEIVVGTGPGTTASVRVFDVSGTPTLVRSFAPFTAGFNGGVFLATGQLSPSDPAPAIVVGAGVNGASKVEVWDWKAPNASLFKLSSFNAYTDASKNAPVHVATQDFNGDGLVDAILTSQGPGGATGQIRAFNIAGGQLGMLTGFNFPSFVAAIAKPDPSLFAPKPVVLTAIKPLTTSLTSPTAGNLLSNLGSLSPSAVDQLFASLGLGWNTWLSNLLGPIKTGLA